MAAPLTGGPAPARTAAAEALRRAARGDVFVQDALHDIFRETETDAADRALATLLATGAVRHRRTLRRLISHVRGPGRRASAIQPDLLTLLELGALQLVFLDRIPAYAAVNEAVAAARASSRSPSAAGKRGGFVNGVLRGLQRLIRGRDPDGAPGPDAVPHPQGGVVRLNEPLLPDREADPVAFLGIAYSLPDWLVARWVRAFPEDVGAVCAASARWPRLIARAAGDAASLAERLAADGYAVEAGPRPATLDLSGLPQTVLHALLQAGTVAVQDPSAMRPVEALAPQPGETVLDLCASPGTKTVQMAEATGGEARILACDRTEAKLELIRRAVAERGLENVDVALAEEAASRAPAGGFDAVLVDAPCSNTGVLARRVDVRWRLHPDDIAELARVQAGLLDQAAGLVRPGGRLVYATCSLEPEENDLQGLRFLERHPGWRNAGMEQALPGRDHDGAFWVRLDRGGGAA